MSFKIISNACVVLAWIVSLPALGLDGVKFGPEFTVTRSNSEIDTYLDVYKRMVKHLVEDQPRGARFEKKKRSFHLTSPNGWWFEANTEHSAQGGGVIEITMSPLEVADYRRFKDDMQDAIFVSAANEGYFPAMFRGGGHINIGTQVLFKNPRLLRNFVVDLLNHNELFMGILNYDTNNALPFQMLKKKTQKALVAAIANFDRQLLAGRELNDDDLEDFLTALDLALCYSKDPFLLDWDLAPPIRYKHHAVSFIHTGMLETSRIELRGVRPQASMDVWIRQIDLFQHRLDYLEKMTELLPIRTVVPITKIKLSKHRLNPPIEAKDALRAFYRYVTKSGLKWQDHRDYLWPNWITDGSLEKFEASGWFLKRERRQCERALAARS